ncbi:MFS transporter [Paraburkholderia graminis]|jgi:MFS family permease|uniref:MFS family permease n=1 Tax=Paraburkholderia graminis TaxID=60548 RepID=A0ABD5CR45_9BURK|nr:MFS transporter [Paraburkholderia graminis]MDQ0622813.1 MFS family permease [Paraburkholderia graminis]MDR6207005.1 MFS family permease [Paraburkholderia graminis]
MHSQVESPPVSIDDRASSHAAGRPLGARDYRTLALAALGGTLEFYDFVIFVFFTSVIGSLFFPPGIPDWLRQFQTFGIFAVGYFVRPVGGIVMAHFGDLLGRKKMFTLSVLLMSLPTLLIGVLPTFAQIGFAAPLLLLLMRVLQGAAVGGEVPGAWVFVSEHVPRRHVGLACGTLTGGLTAGILLGSLVATATNAAFDRTDILAFAWRLPFIAGGIFGIVAMFLRRWLEETPVFRELQARKAVAASMPLRTVMRSHLRGVALSMTLTWTLSAVIIVIVLMMPALMQKNFHLPPADTLAGSSVATIALTIGCVVAGLLSDRIGPRLVLALGSALLAVCFTWFYGRLHVGAPLQAWLGPYTVTGFAVGMIGAIPLMMVRAFPAAIRFTGISFSYNIAYAIFGGLTPILISLASVATAMAPVIYVVALCIVAIVAAVCQRGATHRDR